MKPTEDLADLGEALGLGAPPRVMECFDISNVSSNHIVASMVRFTNGQPDNGNYRRYRIRTVTGQDDFASMAEVIFRRYSRILRENTGDEDDFSQENLIDRQRRLAAEGKAKDRSAGPGDRGRRKGTALQCSQATPDLGPAGAAYHRTCQAA